MRSFKMDSRLHKFLSVLCLPFMAVASGIALVGYVCTMFLTIVVIQAIGLILGVYSALKWVYEGTLHLFSHTPVPVRR